LNDSLRKQEEAFMRTILSISVGLVFSTAAAYAGPTGPCPASVTDDVKAPGGAAQVEHTFKEVAFYLGDPKDNDGVPSDDDSEKPRQLDQHWVLTRVPGKPITMVCRYRGTNKTVVDTLPANITSCVLEGKMDEHGEILGSPTLTCK
jgi:hypothetical protein